eukprot:55373-Rhodomonas_salina.1
MGYLQATDLHGLKYISAKNWLWSTHKLLGHPSKYTTEHCKHEAFKVWINSLESWSAKSKAFFLLRSLGPLVGDRFWAVFKNAACIYALRRYIQQFLVDNLAVCAGEKGRTEDAHSKAVHTISCMDLVGDAVPRHQCRIMNEVRVKGLLGIIVMGAALHVSAK